MKTRIALSFVTLSIFYAVRWLWSLVESPVRGATTAAQLNDTTASYIAAQALRDNPSGILSGVLLVSVLAAIWFFPPTKTTNKK